MIALAFFYLLRPGEYTASPTETTPFAFADIQLFIGHNRLSLTHATDAAIRTSTFARLTFTTQKNGVQGKVIGLARSGEPLLCPVRVLIHRVLHLQHHYASLNTPLATYFHQGQAHTKVTPSDITTALCHAVNLLGPELLGFNAADISARSLRAARAIALLCAQVDTDIICLIGRWRSDEMLRYLHVQAEPVMQNFAACMLQRGDFILHPNQDVPSL